MPEAMLSPHLWGMEERMWDHRTPRAACSAITHDTCASAPGLCGAWGGCWVSRHDACVHIFLALVGDLDLLNVRRSESPYLYLLPEKTLQWAASSPNCPVGCSAHERRHASEMQTDFLWRSRASTRRQNLANLGTQAVVRTTKRRTSRQRNSNPGAQRSWRRRQAGQRKAELQDSTLRAARVQSIAQSNRDLKHWPNLKRAGRQHIWNPQTCSVSVALRWRTSKTERTSTIKRRYRVVPPPFSIHTHPSTAP